MPPLVGDAVKLVLVPAQIFDAVELMDTEGVTLELTVSVTLFDVAVGEEAQLSFDVKTQETTSLLAIALSMYEMLFVPTLLPFFFH